MHPIEEKHSIVSDKIDSVLRKLQSHFPPEKCQKHLTIFQKIGHLGILTAGVLGFIFGLMVAVKTNAFSAFLIGSGWLIAMLVADYVSVRFSQVAARLVRSTKSQLSSGIYIEAIALIVLVASVVTFTVGIYAAVSIESFAPLVKLGAWAAWLFYLGLITLNAKELLNVEIKPELKAEQEGLGLVELNAKSSLLAVSFYFGTGMLLGLLNVVWSVFQYMRSGADLTYAISQTLPYFTLIAIVALLPLLACLAFLLLYASIAAVKSLVRIAAILGKDEI